MSNGNVSSGDYELTKKHLRDPRMRRWGECAESLKSGGARLKLGEPGELRPKVGVVEIRDKRLDD